MTLIEIIVTLAVVAILAGTAFQALTLCMANLVQGADLDMQRQVVRKSVDTLQLAFDCRDQNPFLEQPCLEMTTEMIGGENILQGLGIQQVQTGSLQTPYWEWSRPDRMRIAVDVEGGSFHAMELPDCLMVRFPSSGHGTYREGVAIRIKCPMLSPR